MIIKKIVFEKIYIKFQISKKLKFLILPWSHDFKYVITHCTAF